MAAQLLRYQDLKTDGYSQMLIKIQFIFYQVKLSSPYTTFEMLRATYPPNSLILNKNWGKKIKSSVNLSEKKQPNEQVFNYRAQALDRLLDRFLSEKILRQECRTG